MADGEFHNGTRHYRGRHAESGQAGGGTAGPIGKRVLFSVATAIMATSVALTPVMDGALVPIIYQVMRH